MSTIEKFAELVAYMEQILPALKAIGFGGAADVEFEGEVKPSLEKRFADLVESSSIDFEAAGALLGEMTALVADAENALAAAPLVRGYWPSTAAGIGNGVAGHGTITAGTGGTNGSYAFVTSGGSQQISARGWVLVEGGGITKVTITHPGYYTGTPTVDLSGIPGLAGAAVPLVMSANTPVGSYFMVGLQRYRVDPGPVAVAEASKLMTESGTDARIAGQLSGAIGEMYSAPVSRRIVLVATTDSAGRVVANSWFDVDLQALVINGHRLQIDSDVSAKLLETLQGDIGDMYRAPVSPRIVLAATTDSAGRVVSNVWYEAQRRALVVNGVDVGASAGLQYEPLEPLPSELRPLVTAIRHLMTYGQSLSKGVQGVPVHSAIQPYLNITFAAGPRATLAGSVGLNPGMGSFIPLIENTAANDGEAINIGETPCSAWANGLTRRQAERGIDWRAGSAFLGTANGRSSARITQLLPGGMTAEGEWFQVVRDAINQAAALAPEDEYSLPVAAYMQGEGDNDYAGAGGGAYGGWLGGVHEAITAHYLALKPGAPAPWLALYQTYARTRRDRPHATLDQIEYAETVPNAFHVTALYHLPLAHDGHLSTLGSYWVGEYLAKRCDQLLAGYRPQWLRRGAATIKGRVITYRPRQIPVAPLRLHFDAWCRPTTNYGFAVVDASGAAGIESVYIGADGRSVVVTVARDITGEARLRYGLDYLPAGQIDYAGAAGGNLVDSDPETFVYAGSQYPLYNVSPHFEINVIPV